MDEIFEYKYSIPSKPILLHDLRVLKNSLSINVLHREEQLASITKSVNSLIFDKKPDHLFIYGKSGSGKTTCLQCVLSKFRNTNGLIVIYVNCHEHQTKMAIFTKIANELGSSLPSKGFATYEVFGRIKELLEKENKSVLLVLDDIDALIKNGLSDVFYPIVESNEKRRNSFSVIATSNDFKMFEQLDAKIKSSLMFKVIDFKTYTKEEIKRILQSVAETLLAENSYSDEIINEIAKIGVYNEGNARFAIGILLDSAKNAEQRNSDKIESIDVQTICERLFPIASLCQEEVLLLDILKNGEKTSSAIYELSSKKMDRSKRQIRNYLASLIRKAYVESKPINGDNSTLKPRLFRLKKR